MRIDSLHAATSTRLAVVDLDATLETAASSLSQPGIGLVVVCSDTGAAGVLTKSDLVRHLATAGAADAPVALLMSRPIVSCEPDEDVYGVWQTMTARKLQTFAMRCRRCWSTSNFRNRCWSTTLPGLATAEPVG